MIFHIGFLESKAFKIPNEWNWKDSAEQIQHNDMDKLPLIHLGVAIHPPLCLRPDLFVWKVQHLNSKGPFGEAFGLPPSVGAHSVTFEGPFRAEVFHHLETWIAMPTHSPTLPKPWLSELKIITRDFFNMPHQHENICWNVELWKSFFLLIPCMSHPWVPWQGNWSHGASLASSSDGKDSSRFSLLDTLELLGIQKRHYYNLGVTDGHVGVTSRQKKTWGHEMFGVVRLIRH